ncbi:MAG: hypothetical protein ACLFR8_09860 [Alkalispirochaeta sp.]
MNKSRSLPTLPVLLVITVLSVLSACVTPTDTPPDWIGGIADTDLADDHLIAYGRSPERREAERLALVDAERQVAQILIRGLEEKQIPLTDKLVTAVERTASTRTRKLEEIDRYSRTDAMESHEWYLLLRYPVDTRNADIAALTRERVPDDSETEPLRPREDDVIERLEALLTREVPRSSAERRRILNEALGIASQIVVTARPGETSTPLGTPVDRPIEVSVSNRTDGTPLRDVPFFIRITGPDVDGTRSESVRTAVTGREGSFQIDSPDPRYAGTTVVVAEPDWHRDSYDEWAEQLDSTENRDLLDAIANRIRGRSVLRVTSQAAEIPTAVVIVDRDIAGNPMADSRALRGVIREFSAREFRVRRVELDEAGRERLIGLDRIEAADLYDLLPFEVLASVDRAIVGDATIYEFEEDEGFSVGVRIEAIAFDLRRDRRLAQVTVTERITGSSAQATIRGAFQEAGRRLARQIAPQLP